MLNRCLTHDQAVDCLHRYFRNEPVQDITGRYLVNSWRLYDVLNGDTHDAARAEFRDWAKCNDPELFAYLSTHRRWRRDGSLSESGLPLFSEA